MFATLGANKRKLFWVLQTLGWAGYALLNYLQGLAHDKEPEYLYPTVAYALGGFVITLGLRAIYRPFWDRHPAAIAAVAAVGVFLAAAAFDAYKTWMFVHLYPDYWWQPAAWIEYFSNLPLSLYIMLAWSGLYFGIKYYQTVQSQNEMVLKATNAAHQAQLKMLRYQLNPHFLFNTLNAISTLVLEGRSREANDMVTRLSTFLRHSLDRDPKQKVTLQRELEAINLYLGIEKIRFDERLRLDFDIDPAAEQALVPSLILQPLIENALKYAIACSESGGTIKVGANIIDDDLCLTVCDDGPGAPELVEATKTGRSGVGLANTRERLEVLYGPKHQLRLENGQGENGDPRGLRVRICIPLELSNE